MALFKERFDTWSAADLAAYEPQKWASKRFNLERGRVRLRLISLLEQVAERAELDTAGLEIWTSRDHPNIFNSHKVERQWAVWCRPVELRSQMARFDAALAIKRPLDSHLHMGVVIDREGLRLLLRLPAGARFDQGVRQDLVDALGPLAQCDDDGQVQAQAHHSAATLLAGGAELDHIQGWLADLWPAFRAGLWTLDNDPDGLGPALSVAAEPAVVAPPAPTSTQEPSRPQIAPPRSRSPDPIELTQPRPPRVASPDSAPGPGPRSAPRQPEQRPDRGQTGERRPDRGQAGGPRPDRGQAGGPRPDRSQAAGPRPDRGQRNAPRPDRPRPDLHGPPRPKRDSRGPGDRPRDAAPARRPEGARGTFKFGPDRDKAAAVELALGAAVCLKYGLFAGKQGVVAGVKGDRVKVTVGAISLVVARNELELL